MAQLYLDCDGVLADFDAGVEQLLGMGPAAATARYGRGGFWQRLARAPDFYARLPLMADAMMLVEAVRPLRPIILTGLPIGSWAEPQKRAWGARHFPDLPMITLMARDKHRHARPGDVLIDDSLRLAEAWQGAGGHFIHHRDADTSLSALRARGLLQAAAG